jgi:hypothetical protein
VIAQLTPATARAGRELLIAGGNGRMDAIQ